MPSLSTGGWFSHAKYRQPSNKLFFVRTKQNMFFWPQKSRFPQHKCKTWAWQKNPSMTRGQKTCNLAPGATLYGNNFLGMPLTDGIMSKSTSPGSSHLNPDRTCLSHADASRKGPISESGAVQDQENHTIEDGPWRGPGSLRSRISAWRLGDIFLRLFNVKIIYIPPRT